PRHPHSGKSEDNRLPQSSARRCVNASCRVAHVVLQIDFGSHLEVTLGFAGFAQSCGDNTVDARTETAAVTGPRLVIFVISLFNFEWIIVRQKMKQQDDVSL